MDGGPLPFPDAISSRGVVVSNQTRLGSVSYDQCLDHDTGKWLNEDEKVQGSSSWQEPAHHGGPAKVKAWPTTSTASRKSPENWYKQL